MISDTLTISLLAPSPSALHCSLKECEDFAQDMDIVFNAAKTQLIYFRLNQRLNLGQFSFNFCDLPLQFTDKIKHLGHFIGTTLITLRISREFLMICAVKLISSCTLSGPVIQLSKLSSSPHIAFLCMGRYHGNFPVSS